jgi:hypothetical protein
MRESEEHDMDEETVPDREARAAIRTLAARVDGMTDAEAHNALCQIWWELPRQPKEQIKEIARSLDSLTAMQLLRAIAAAIHS